MNGHALKSTTQPWDTLGPALGFENEDQKFWWDSTAPVLGKFLQKSDYSEAKQFSYLSWYHRYILPAYGPRAEPDKEANWPSHVIPGPSLFQPSLNIKGNKTTVRFTIEPVGYGAGTNSDPLNQEATVTFMKRMKQAFPRLHDEWFWETAKEFYFPNDVVNIMVKTGKLPAKRPPNCLIAFDLNEDAVELKAYLFPQASAFLNGTTYGDRVFETVKRFNKDGINFDTTVLEEYLRAGEAPGIGLNNIHMLSMDLIEPSQSRVKIYLHSFNNSYNKLKEVYTLGGRIKDKAINDSLGPLKELWRLLYDMPEKGFEDTELPNIMHPRSGFVFAFEFKAGEPLPVTKIYLPMWHYVATDVKISAALTAFFASQGLDKLAKTYSSDMQDIFQEPKMADSTGTHQYISFSANAKHGLYMTLYYCPTIPYMTKRYEPAPVGEGNPVLLMGLPRGTPPLPLRILRGAWPALKWVMPAQVKNFLAGC